MALNIYNAIVEADIYYVKELAPGHPVYQLEGLEHNPQDTLVIKKETGGSLPAGSPAAHASIRHNAKIMNAVNPNAKQKILSAAEVQQVQSWTAFCVANPPPVDLTGVRALNTDLQTPGTWIKMETKNLTTLQDAVSGRLGGDKADARRIASALTRAGGLEKLGSIAAADLFNGSADRFYYPGPGAPIPGGGGSYNHLQNVGNIFVATGNTANSATPIGIDSFDYMSQFKDVTVAVGAQEQASGEQWPGRILAANQTQTLRGFARGCVADLETALGPRNRKIAVMSTRKLPKDADSRFEAGMRQGTNALQAKLVPRRATLPIGLQSRMTLLGW